MNITQTLTIIKPDAVKAGNAGAIISMIEKAGFKILTVKYLQLSKAQAEGFYGVHRDKKFFSSLITFMTEGPVFVIALEKENAIDSLRKLMGPTNVAEAPPDTIRGQFGTNIERNAIHGSDGPETAAFEIGYFFPGYKLIHSVHN